MLQLARRARRRNRCRVALADSFLRVIRPAVYLTLRRFRHLAALLLGVLLIQGSLLGAGMTCAATASAMTTTAEAGGGHGHHAPGAPDETTEQRGHEHGQMHCPAATACATVGVAGAVTALPAAVLVPTAQIAALDAARPASVAGAPEPPPPRG